MKNYLQKITIETVQDIIEKSQLAYPQTDEPTVIYGSEMNIDDVFSISLEEKILEDTISALKKEELAELAAIMWLGRGEDVSYNDLVADALSRYDDSFPSYISDKTTLADYLKVGLNKLRSEG